jgi:hypothetical protein
MKNKPSNKSISLFDVFLIIENDFLSLKLIKKKLNY